MTRRRERVLRVEAREAGQAQEVQPSKDSCLDLRVVLQQSGGHEGSELRLERHCATRRRDPVSGTAHRCIWQGAGAAAHEQSREVATSSNNGEQTRGNLPGIHKGTKNGCRQHASHDIRLRTLPPLLGMPTRRLQASGPAHQCRSRQLQDRVGSDVSRLLLPCAVPPNPPCSDAQNCCRSEESLRALLLRT